MRSRTTSATSGTSPSSKERPRRLTYANVTSTLALVIALTAGTAYAANEWTGENIVDGTVTGADVRGRDATVDKAAVNGSITSADVSGQPPDVEHGKPFVDGSLTTWDLKDRSVRSADLATGAVGNSRLGADAVTGDKVAPDTLTGADVLNNSLDGADITNLTGSDLQSDTLSGFHINESLLATVPNATNATNAATAARGGIGRWAARGTACDPESETFVDCGYTTLNLPGPSRVLLIGRIVSWRESHHADSGYGHCRLATSAGAIGASTIEVGDGGEGPNDQMLLTVTGVMGPGTYDFGIECNQGMEFGAIWFWDSQIAAVALSPT